MLKYSSLIEKLSDSQKIRMLTGIGSLSGKDFKVIGIPQVKIGNVKEFCKEHFPKASELAHAWDREIWQLTAEEKLGAMAAQKINCALTPGPKVKISPYRNELTEDPYLATEIATAYSKAAAGGVSAMSGYYLASSETAWLDEEPSERALNDFLISPYKRALESSGVDAVLADIRPLNKAYDEWPIKLLDTANTFASRFVICERATEENTVELISRGIICLEASSNALEGAMTKYKNTMASIERNGMSLEESLREDEKLFLAVSPEVVDAAVDNLLDFVFSCNEKRPESRESVSEETAKRAVLESTVLLKNKNGILPLSNDAKVAIVGSCGHENEKEETVPQACKALLEARGINCVSVSKGYGTESLVDAAVVASRDADVVLLFLGFKNGMGKDISKKESLYLPAEQLCLVDRLAFTGKKLVVVLSSAYAVDVEFSARADAMLFAPLDTVYSAEAVASIVTGEYNPSGRLACSLYAGSKVAFDKRLYYSDHGMKVGPFVGYRYYDTADMRIGYPFGYGLSYTLFRYSGLSLNGKRLSFTVKNVGNRAGCEVAEVYVGKNSSAVIRPRKELCGFERVALQPGESRKIEIDVQYPEIYLNGEYVLEDGAYTVFVGSSVSDIKLSCTVNVHGEKLPSERERISDYLQSVSNVLEDDYTLEAKYNTMKRNVKNIVAGVAAIVFAISLAAFNSFSGISSTFIGVIAGLLALSSIIFFVLDNVEKSKAYAKHQEEIDEANNRNFEGAEKVDSLSAGKMFSDLFDAEEHSNETDFRTSESRDDDSHLAYIDNRYTLRDTLDEFERFATEKGYKFAEDTLADLFASLATSKLLVSAGLPSDDFNAMVRLLSEYFGSDSYVGTSTSAVSEHGEEDSHEDKFVMSLPFALNNALAYPEKIHIIALDRVSIERAVETIRPFAKYISCAKDYNEIQIAGPFNTVSYTIPANVWLFVNLEEGADISSIPVVMARQMAYNGVRLFKCPLAESLSVVRGLNRYQLEYIAEKGSKCDVPEELWKKVDKLEKYVGEHSEYCIGNKLWLNFEKQLSLLISLGTDLSAALDSAIAARLMPSMTVSVNGKLGDDDKGMAETLEFIFGEDNVKRCKDFIDGIVKTAPAASTEKPSDAGATAEEKATSENKAATEKDAATDEKADA